MNVIVKMLRQFLIILLLILLSGCKDNEMLYGKKVSFYFPDEKAAELALAASRGHVSEIENLVENGVNVNYQGYKNITPLIWALFFKNSKGVKKLLELGANPDLCAQKSVYPVIIAAKFSDARFLRLILSHAANIDVVDYQGWSALLVAASEDKIENIKLLLHYGADINSHSDYGRNAAMVSATFGYFDLVYFFLDSGLSYNLKGVARAVDVRKISKDSKQLIWKEKSIILLKKKGIKFPTIPEADLN